MHIFKKEVRLCYILQLCWEPYLYLNFDTSIVFSFTDYIFWKINVKFNSFNTCEIEKSWMSFDFVFIYIIGQHTSYELLELVMAMNYFVV
jgi:hypothetical protein